MQSINYDYKRRLPRQKLKKQYVENGAIYIFKYNLFKKFRNVLFGRIGTYIMEEDRSVDIDDKKDFQKAKNYLISNMS
jgi:CMP-N-acetylneuraminic acid synthetase